MAVQSKNYLPQLAVKINAHLARSVRATALAIEKRAKELCPVRSGKLRDSIHTEARDLRTGRFVALAETNSGKITATVGTNCEYAPFIEFGTRHSKGQPFLTPAMDEVEGKFKSEIGNLERSLK